MNFFRHFYLDEADGSGDGAANAAASKAAGDDAGAGTGTPGEGEGAKTGGDKKPEDGKATEPTIESLTADLKGRDDELGKLKTKLGHQSKAVGTVNTFNKMFAADPKKAILGLAEKYDVKLQEAGKREDRTSFFDAMKSDDPEVRDKAIQDSLSQEKEDALSKNLEAKLDRKYANKFSILEEGQLRAEYPDLDDLADDRASIQGGMTMGNLSDKEVIHLAARGMNVQKAMEDAAQRAVEEYKVQLAKKAGGQVDMGGSGEASPGKGKKVLQFENVVADLNALPPG